MSAVSASSPSPACCNIHPSWQPHFDQFDIDLDSIYAPRASGNAVFPPRELVFRVFEMAVDQIDILLLAQDPYHAPGQAHGLCLSVPPGIRIPPSLANIYKELKLEFPERNYVFPHGNLTAWFEREHIFLLNSALTVESGNPTSDLDLWVEFTDATIRFISDHNPRCVFLLLGAPAKAKRAFICDKSRIVEGVHPSPRAQGFIGSGVFKQVEAKLGRAVDWRI